MSAERPISSVSETMLVAMTTEHPEQLRADRVEDAMSVLKGEKDAVVPKPPEPEPTKKQLFWRDIYRSGKLTPYQKDRPGIKLSAIAEAWRTPETQNEKSRIMAVDMAIRGGADKEYNQLGDMTLRVKRMGTMAVNSVPFFVFDVVTSIPAGLVNEYAKKWVEKNTHLKDRDKRLVNGLFTGTSKIIDVQNDKVVTALGDMLVDNLAGEKSSFTHEVWDKMADLVQTAADDYMKDAVNGPVLESINRALYQIPVAGALWEQLWTRVSLAQEKSQLNKGIAKSFYMGIGTAIGTYRELKKQEIDMKKAPSTKISLAIWKKINPRLFKN